MPAARSPGDGGCDRREGRSQSPPSASGRCRSGSSITPPTGRSAHTEAKDSETTPDRLDLQTGPIKLSRRGDHQERREREGEETYQELLFTKGDRHHSGPAEEWLRRRPFSGAISVGMARLGGLDAEYPIHGTRHLTRRRGPGAAQSDAAQNKRPFAEVADGPTPLRAAAGTAEGQGSWP